jgi:polysaccharide deacetylase 2 family uncharacterized protein YibQ
MNKKNLEYALLGLLLALLSIILFVYINFEDILEEFDSNNYKEQEVKIVNTYEENALLIKRLQKILDETTKELDNMEQYELMTEASDYEENINTTPQQKHQDIIFKEHDDIFEVKDKKTKIIKKDFKDNKIPKLVIIVDDIILESQVNAINSLGLNINLSFLPPNDMHPNSALVAKKQKSHMIHLPLEAYNYNNVNYNVLKDTDTLQNIEKEIIRLKKIYPNAKYVNNHTGSKFTSNMNAMKRLIYVLDKHGFKFIDSRTSKYTKANEASKALNIDIMSRKIFLDNMANVSYIKKQIKKAVRLAKKDGFAIAICHPKSATIKALAMSKKIFKDVELTYVNDL